MCVHKGVKGEGARTLMEIIGKDGSGEALVVQVRKLKI